MSGDSRVPFRRDLRRVHETWEHLARADPYWAVLTEADKQGGAWDEEQFFETGRAEIDALFKEIGERLPGRERALDFGCGVGRLTQALAGHFERSDGVDVAPSMVELARRHDRSGGRCRFHLNTRPDLSLFENGTFDLVYSNITLQHMPSKLALLYVGEFLRMLRPGGLAVFQLPFCREPPDPWAEIRRRYFETRRFLRRKAPDWIYRSYRRVVAPGQPLPPPEPQAKTLEMQMYSTAPSAALETIESAGGRVLEMRVWGDVGDPWWDSYLYIAQRSDGDRHDALDARIEILGPVSPVRVGVGDPLTVRLRISNRGETRWLATAVESAGWTRLGAHLYALGPGDPDDASAELLDFDWYRGELPRDLAPGESAEVEIQLPAIDRPGRYRIVFDLVAEQVVWFAQRGSETTEMILEVSEEVRSARSPPAELEQDQGRGH